jgi:hypothetical protein
MTTHTTATTPITDLPSPPPLAPAQTGQRRSNLVRGDKGKIIKNDRKQTFAEREAEIFALVARDGYYATSGLL